MILRQGTASEIRTDKLSSNYCQMYALCDRIVIPNQKWITMKNGLTVGITAVFCLLFGEAILVISKGVSLQFLSLISGLYCERLACIKVVILSLTKSCHQQRKPSYVSNFVTTPAQVRARVIATILLTVL